MITRISLENWKSFGEGTLHIDPLTILIGTNASGKSNILDALSLLQRVGEGYGWQAAVGGQSRDEPGIRGGVEWLVRRGASSIVIQVQLTDNREKSTEYAYCVRLGVSEDGRVETLEESLTRYKQRTNKGNYRYSKRLFYAELKESSGPSITTYVSNNKQGRGRRFDLRRNASLLAQLQSMAILQEVKAGISEVLGQLKGIYVFDPIPSQMRDYSRLSERLLNNGENLAGVLAALDVEQAKKIEDLLIRYLHRLPENEIHRIYAEPVGKLGTDAMLYCEEKYPDGTIITMDARGMSDGTLRFLGILTALLTLPPHSLLVVEEIDNGLHPSRSFLLVELLNSIGRERDVDVICTTHNPALLNELGNSMVPYISIVYREDKSGHSKVKLLEDIEHLPRLMARGRVGTLLSKGILEEAIQ